MSGIFGIIHRNGRPVESGDLERMRDTMAHRGPDGSNIWLDGEAALGQLMLCSTPESLDETLPWKDPESGLVITADARIDNRDEIFGGLDKEISRTRHGTPQALLRLRRNRTRSIACANPLPQVSDSWLILEAYKRWGDACVDHLLGDFAFAIWDPRKKKLFCARDHMGIRPFYYYLSDDLFVFASSALGVVSVAAVPKRISEVRIADYLLEELEGVDKTCTWFEDIWRMPPAHIGALSRKHFNLWEYWRPDPDKELRLSSDDEYTDAFEDALTTAIRVRMRSPKPVASMLSGGLDSSTIVGIARNLQQLQSGRPFKTISGVSEANEDCQESAYIQMMIEQGGLDATLLRSSDVERFSADLQQVDSVLEDPFDAMWVMHKMIYLSAQDNDYTAVMDGIDGDGVTSLTASYPKFLLREGRLWTAHREILGRRINYHRVSNSLWKEYTGVMRAAFIPDFARQIRDKLRHTAKEQLPENCLLAREQFERLNMPQRTKNYRKNAGLMDCKSLRYAHAKRVIVPYLTAGIERYGRLASVCGVEQRQPLLDKRFVEFCISLPWEQKIRNGVRKTTMRWVADRFLPQEVAWQRGWGRVNWKFWYAWNEMNKRKNCMLLNSIGTLDRVPVDKKKFQEAVNQYNIGGIESTENILGLVCLLNWLQRNR